MKSFRLSVSLWLIAVSAMPVAACGPFAPSVPTPEFFSLSGSHKDLSYYEKEENLKLWQSLTSRRIPLADIEEAVYKSESIYGLSENNLFVIYLYNSGDTEIIDFLNVAKWLEKERSDMRSPWYYPQSRDSHDPTGDFDEIIERCKSYAGVRLKDRYALQLTRALFASRQYAACIEHFDSAFANIPNSNLMKRMAQRYVAGCWHRLGEKQRADSIFAKIGDVWSISSDDVVGYMARMNPNAPLLMEYVRSNAGDEQFMKDMIPMAKKLLADKRVKNKGDWYFLQAYIHGEFVHNPSLARKEIYRAMRQSFSTAELKDCARAYKMKLDARTGNMQTLLSDLKWMESKADTLDWDGSVWQFLNIVYLDWVPNLWKRKDYATAILLCAYADNLVPSIQWHYSGDGLVSMNEMRKSKTVFNDVDYRCLSFQLMGSLTSVQLDSVYSRVKGNSSLYSYLRRKARTDADYYNELIGTLALREENYARAVSYLSKVGKHYLRTMNIDKDGYLSRNPFDPYVSRWKPDPYPYGDEDEWEGGQAARHSSGQNPGAKLSFARKMLSYKLQMTGGRTADECGLARLMYAIGRRNSFEECWVLTQYWRGGWPGGFIIFIPIPTWDDALGIDEIEEELHRYSYDFLFDYDKTIGHKNVEKLYQKEIAASLAMLVTKEAKAKANYILGRLRTIVKYYGDTPTGKFVKSSCDNWKSWL